MIVLATGPASPRQISLIEQIEAMKPRPRFLSDMLFDHQRGKKLTFGMMDKAQEIIKERNAK